MKQLALVLICWTVLIQRTSVAIDGDTFETTIEIWPRLFTVERVRVIDIDTPEMQKSTLVQALEAKKFTQAWLDRGPFSLFVCKRDAFGRLLGKVYRGDSNLADELKKAGHVKSDTVP